MSDLLKKDPVPAPVVPVLKESRGSPHLFPVLEKRLLRFSNGSKGTNRASA